MFVHPHTESMDGCKLDHRLSLPRSAHELLVCQALASETLPLAAAESEEAPSPAQLHDKAKMFRV